MVLPRWKMPKGKFVLKVGKRDGYFMKAGTCDDGGGESKPAAQTTMYISEAFGFRAYKAAEAMRIRLREQYGLSAAVVKLGVRRDA